MLRGLDWGVHIASTSVNRRFICYLIMSQRIFKDSCDLPSVSPFSLYPAYSTLGKQAFLILSKHVCCPRAWRTLSCQFLLFGILCLLTILLLLHSTLSSNTNTMGWLDTLLKLLLLVFPFLYIPILLLYYQSFLLDISLLLYIWICLFSVVTHVCGTVTNKGIWICLPCLRGKQYFLLDVRLCPS